MGKYKRKKQTAEEQVSPAAVSAAAAQSEEEKKQASGQDKVSTKEILDVYEELDQLKADHPDIVAEVAPHLAKKTVVERIMELYLKVRNRFHIETRVDKKTYCRLCILGIIGVHQFYSRHWIKGLLYIGLSWCGLSVAMTILDWMAAVPKKEDADGMIVV